jgi:1D-myo-inositol-tetrakisphosphate 5-kinase/inositol-polyphosphate multikinase
MATKKGQQLDASQLKAFENAAAGHDGVLSDPSGELIIKPCTEAEINFYQETVNEHSDFAEMMPTFMGTLQLGASSTVEAATAAHEGEELTQAAKDQQLTHGVKLATQTAIVLENLEHGFKKANVLDLKLGARLYEDGTKPDKAARLDKVASETTSGSLNFRIAGMKVWNGETFDIYDKFYGRKFNAENVQNGFETFFSGLSTGLKSDMAQELLETILAEITKARHMLEKYESRMYSASVLIVYEGDSSELEVLMGGELKTPRVDERMPTQFEVKKSIEEEEEEEEQPPVTFKVKMIDFAHAEWASGKGPDENVIVGLKNVEKQMDQLIARFD